MATKYSKGKDGWYSTLVWDGTYVNGKKHRKQIRSNKSSADLEKKVAEFKRSLEGQVFTVESESTFSEFYDAWLAFKKNEIKALTHHNYSNLKNSYEYIWDIKLKDICLEDVVNMLATIPDGTKKVAFSVFKSSMTYAAKRSYISKKQYSSIFDFIKNPKYKAKEKRGLTQDEREGFKNAKYDKEIHKVLIYLAYGCGLRKAEILALTVDDIDTTKKQLRVNKIIIQIHNKPILQESPKSDRGYRTVPIPTFVNDYLKEYLADKEGIIFKGKRYDYVTNSSYQNMFKQCLKAFEEYKGYMPENLTLHTFRHNYCSSLCYQIPKVSIPTIAKLMGDSVEVVMKVYSHILQEMEDQVGAIESALNID